VCINIESEVGEEEARRRVNAERGMENMGETEGKCDGERLERRGQGNEWYSVAEKLGSDSVWRFEEGMKASSSRFQQSWSWCSFSRKCIRGERVICPKRQQATFDL